MGEVSLDRSGTGFRTNCLLCWTSFSDLEKVEVLGKKDEKGGRQEHFLLGFVILATAIVDASPSAAGAASTGGKRKGVRQDDRRTTRPKGPGNLRRRRSEAGAETYYYSRP